MLFIVIELKIDLPEVKSDIDRSTVTLIWLIYIWK